MACTLLEEWPTTCAEVVLPDGSTVLRLRVSARQLESSVVEAILTTARGVKISARTDCHPAPPTRINVSVGSDPLGFRDDAFACWGPYPAPVTGLGALADAMRAAATP